jgi:DNA-binding protein YbaB
MSNDMHPLMAEVMRQSDQFQTLLESRTRQIKNEKFTGTDEARTVQVTLDGRQWLTDLYIEDGLLRLGLATVAQRVNEAMWNAQATASAAGEDENRQFIDSLNGFGGPLDELVGRIENPQG